MSQEKTPAIRFRAFQENWDMVPLGDVCTFGKGKGFSKKDLKPSGTPLILYGRLYTNYKTRIEVVDTFADWSRDARISKGNEVIVPASGETADEIAIASSVGSEGVMIGSDLNIVTPDATIDPDFLALGLTYARPRAELARVAQGKTVVHIRNSDIAEILFPTPSRSEQNWIFNYFRELDDLLDASAKKVEKLKRLKATMLTKMFPRAGADQPDIRFAGFSGAWEIRRLVDEVTIFGGLTYSPSDISNRGTFVLRSSNVQGGHVVTDDCVYVRSGAVNVQNVRVNDIVMVVRNGSRALIGKHAMIRRGMPNTVIGAFMTGLRAKQPTFVNALVSTNVFTDEVVKSMGATINQITLGMLKEMTFLFPPDTSEQQAIGSFFQELDDLIDREQQMLEKLHHLKSAFLQLMFV